MPPAITERRVIFIVGAVQFVNILDFMMVMPLGPDFARSLSIPASQLGYVGGAYTAAAGVAGLVGALFLDRFDRRRALAVALFGLVAGTASGGFAVNLGTLLAARVLAGIFGGPATSIALAIIADSIPAERRGRALGAVMGAFAAASVIGVPLGLELARIGGWRAPFFGVAGIGLVITAAGLSLLPPMRAHLVVAEGGPPPRFTELFGRPTVLLSWTMTAVIMMANFSVIPNLSAYYQGNLNFPRKELGTLYLIGGTLNFFATRIVGRLVDRYGSFRVAVVGTIWFVLVLYTGFIDPVRGFPVTLLFVAYMLSGSMRAVPQSTLTSKVPLPRERARFMSIQSAVQHFAAAAGAFLSARILHELPGGALSGMPVVCMFSAALAVLFPPLMWAVESRVRAAQAQAAITTG